MQVANKNKMIEDHMIVNALDYPSSSHSRNVNPNIADEEQFSAKDSAYKLMARSKQLNTDPTVNRTSLYCDKLDNSMSKTNLGLDKTRLAKTNNLDISSSTLNSSYR